MPEGSKMLNGITFLESYVVDGAKIMLWLFLSVAALIFLLYTALSLSFPYPLDYGEAPLVDQAQRLAAGQNIYRADLSTPPYTIANYPPVYVLVLTPFVNLFGPTFLVGRLISVLCALASALFLGLMIFTFSKDRLAALATGLIFLTIPFVVHWSSLLRIDLLALALSTAGLYVLVRRPTARASVVAGALLLTAAIYTRQSFALAAPLAGAAWLWSHERRRAIELVAFVGGLSLILFVILNIITGGGFFFNIVSANVNAFGFERLAEQLLTLITIAPVLLLLAVAFLIVGRNRTAAWPLLAFYLIGAILSALTIGKIGSNINYFLELSAALSLVAGVALFWSRTYTWGYGAVLILLALQSGLLMNVTLNEFASGYLTPRRQDQPAIANLEEMVGKTEGPILADAYMGLMTLQNKPLYLQPFELTQLAQADRWDQNDLLDAIVQQTFPLILIHHFPFSTVHKERWTPEMLAAIDQSYRAVQVQAGSVIYRPQEAHDGQAAPVPSPPAEVQPAVVQLGPLQPVSQASFVTQPDLAVSPTQPDHLAAIVNTVSEFECDDFSTCRVELMLYTSTDGGLTWAEQPAFTKGRQASLDGVVAFGPEGTLYVLGIRDGGITLNHSSAEVDYEMTRANQLEVTRAQVSARPWLEADPQTGVLFLSYLAQYRDIFAVPSLNYSTDVGLTWSATARVDQRTALSDLNSFRITPPTDVQVLLGQGDHLALVWTWSPEPWTWPRTVWFAASNDGGNSFAPPHKITETWGSINAAAHEGRYYVLFRPGTEQSQSLVLAASDDGGLTWSAVVINGEIPLRFDLDKAPGLDIAPKGTIDVVFYAHAAGASACLLDIERWQATFETGWIDTCTYDVYYTFSQDGGRTFSEPLQLNEGPVQGDRFVRSGGFSQVGSHLGMASSDSYAHPIWIDTPDVERTQAMTVRIER